MGSSRREFLAGAALLATGAKPAAVAKAVGPAPFDIAAFEARLAIPYRHRQVFAAHKVQGGSVLALMLSSLNAYETGFGEGKGTLHVAAVLYGTAPPIALDGEAWKKYDLWNVLRAVGDPLEAGSQTGNPFMHPSYGDAAVESLALRGASFFVCNNALTGLATHLVTGTNSAYASVDEVLADLRAHVVPGALLVPAGVAALNAAQEAKFTYLQASL